MKQPLFLFLLLLSSIGMYQCQQPATDTETTTQTDEFNWVADTVADLRILRYQVPGWDQLTLDQKKLVYYLTQAGLSGRDIIWDQNYRHNLEIRRALETIVSSDKGDRTGAEWQPFMSYAKRVWFSNGIHHHYANDKFLP
ncbi:MAG: dihydrofolate reductase, partial [Saprospiraceae bacterium]|nr:dihydrofolate reductase [Saprospiraceae bacterium]